MTPGAMNTRRRTRGCGECKRRERNEMMVRSIEQAVQPDLYHDTERLMRLYVGCPHERGELPGALHKGRFVAGAYECPEGHRWEYAGGRWTER
jgi:hypothetical protein